MLQLNYINKLQKHSVHLIFLSLAILLLSSIANAANCPSTICDNTDPGFSAVGDWGTSSFSPGFVGSNYLHDRNNAKGTKSANWAFDIASDGDVAIAAQWASHPNRATAVQYNYAVDGGSAQTCGAPQNQRINGGQFNTLCTVTGLTTGQTLTVSIINSSAGYVIADAVQIEVSP